MFSKQNWYAFGLAFSCQKFSTYSRLCSPSPSPLVLLTSVSSWLCINKLVYWAGTFWSPLSSHPFSCLPTTITHVPAAPRLPCYFSGRSISPQSQPGSALSSRRMLFPTRHSWPSNYSSHLLDQSRMASNVWAQKWVCPSRESCSEKIQNSLPIFTVFG